MNSAQFLVISILESYKFLVTLSTERNTSVMDSDSRHGQNIADRNLSMDIFSLLMKRVNAQSVGPYHNAVASGSVLVNSEIA